MDLVQEYLNTYINWKQTHYSQPIYEKLINLHRKMTPDQKAKVSVELVNRIK